MLTDENLVKQHQANRNHLFSHRFKLGLIKKIHSLMEFAFKLSGLYSRGYLNALNLEIEEIALSCPNLPSEFHQTKILFMSDFHFGGMKELPEKIVEKISTIKADICLLGGDYRYALTHPTLPFIEDMRKVVSTIDAPMGIFGVLGNHDGLEIVSAMENLGVRMLINESIPIHKNNQTIHLVGVDEIIFFQRHDVDKAFQAVPENQFVIFLAHSPDLYQDAEKKGADLYLCGHTHHGQVRLPWIGSIVTFSAAPKSLTEGAWRYRSLMGYTGPGLGAVGARVRFRCPPKVTVLTLNKIGLND
jgi:uncharacterized protein